MSAGRRRAPNELRSTVETELIIATIAQTGCTNPVMAAGTPMPLKRKAIARFCFVLR